MEERSGRAVRVRNVFPAAPITATVRAQVVVKSRKVAFLSGTHWQRDVRDYHHLMHLFLETEKRNAISRRRVVLCAIWNDYTPACMVEKLQPHAQREKYLLCAVVPNSFHLNQTNHRGSSVVFFVALLELSGDTHAHRRVFRAATQNLRVWFERRYVQERKN